MSRPRQIVPNSTYLISRRVVRRHCLLRPDPEMRALIVYLLAVAARRFGILVHAFIVMSTHIQLVVTDVRGVLPKFLEYFHRLVALTTKVLRKWEGSVWDNEQTSVVRLETDEAINESIAYVIANPVAAGLVESASEWPGAISNITDLGGGHMEAARPTVYLDAKRGRWPAKASLELTLPPRVTAASADAWRRVVQAALTEHEELGRKEMARKGWKVLGARRAARVSPFDRATSFEPLRGRNPTFKVARVPGAYIAAVQALRAFRAAYDTALARWRAGIRTVVFPAGTWLMARVHSAVVAT